MLMNICQCKNYNYLFNKISLYSPHIMPITNEQKSHLNQSKLILQSINLILIQSYEQSLKKLQQALWLQQNNATLYFLYSLSLYWVKKYDQSYAALQIAIKMNPLCQIYELPDRQAVDKIKRLITRAIRYQKQLTNTQTLSVSKWYEYTILYHQQTDYQKVQQIYRRLFTKFPEVSQIKTHAFLGNYANMLYDIGKYDEAIQKYEIQIQKDPTEMRFFSNCAMLHTIAGNYDKAEEYIKIALNTIPSRPNFLFNYANILAKTMSFQQSIQKILLSIQKDTSDPIFRFKYALILLLSSEFTQQNISKILENLIFANKIFKECIKDNSAGKANSNKRILSMKNVICLKLFTDILITFVENKVQWEKFKHIINIMSDYLIVGQATKLQLNKKLVQFFKRAFKQLEGLQQIQKYRERKQKQMKEIAQSKRNMQKMQVTQENKSTQISTQTEQVQTWDMQTQTNDLIQNEEQKSINVPVSIGQNNQKKIKENQVDQKIQQNQSKPVLLWNFINRFQYRVNKIISKPDIKRITKQVWVKKMRDSLEGLFD